MESYEEAMEQQGVIRLVIIAFMICITLLYFRIRELRGLTPQSIYNPFLAWEETKKVEGGLELGFLQDRLLLNISFYRNTSSNQLLPYLHYHRW